MNGIYGNKGIFALEMSGVYKKLLLGTLSKSLISVIGVARKKRLKTKGHI